MKKNNPYLANDEIDLGDFIKRLWREKILILSICIICGLAGYLYASFQLQEFKTEIKLKNPPYQLFEPYVKIYANNQNNRNNNNNNPNNNYDYEVFLQFNNDIRLNFLSLDNLQSFIEESREFDNFKAHLKLRNVSAKMYFANKIEAVKEKNLVNLDKYSLVFTKELEGDIFLNNYAEFIKKKTVFNLKKNLKLSISNKIILFENAYENAKLVNLQDPLLKSSNMSSQVVNEPDDLFYKGSKILSQEITYLKKLLIKLENDQFDYEIISDKALNSSDKEMLNLKFFVIGIMFGLFLSLGIIFFKGILKNN
jgi:LPS O-antigen subunit length determinant protein (WzzB/FepE family)